MSERERPSHHVSFGSYDSSSRGVDDDDSERSSSRSHHLNQQHLYSKVSPKRSILNNSSRSTRFVRFKTSNQHFEKVSFESSEEEFSDSLRSSISTSTAASLRKGYDAVPEEGDEDNDIIDLSSNTIEFAHPSSIPANSGSLRNYHLSKVNVDEEAIHEEESTPLMNVAKTKYMMSLKQLSPEEDIPRMVQIASAFLADYESGRACSLPTTDIDSLSSFQLGAHRIRYSTFWRWIKHLAIIACFLSCSYIGFTATSTLANSLEIFFISVFTIDLILIACTFRQKNTNQNNNAQNNGKHFYDHPTTTTTRVLPNTATMTRSALWDTSLMILLIALFIERIYTTISTKSSKLHDGTTNYGLLSIFSSSSHCSNPNVQCFNNIKLFTQALKPIIFFYTSKKCRDALEALQKVAPISTKVVLMELFTILSFATVACRLYSHFEDYDNLPTSFLSLFKCKCYIHIFFSFKSQTNTLLSFVPLSKIRHRLIFTRICLGYVFKCPRRWSTLVYGCRCTMNLDNRLSFSYFSLLPVYFIYTLLVRNLSFYILYDFGFVFMSN